MTPLDHDIDSMISVSRQQRLLLENPYMRRRRTLLESGLPEEEVEKRLDWEAAQDGPIEYGTAEHLSFS